MVVRSIQRPFPRWAVTLGAALLVGMAPSDEGEETPLRTEGRERGREVLGQCSWVTGPPCILRGDRLSSCVMTAVCPAGTRVVSGACEGFTSIAIGRSAPSAELSAWSCAATRLFAIRNDNEIAARALCCP
jgi:hypothetical protein